MKNGFISLTQPKSAIMANESVKMNGLTDINSADNWELVEASSTFKIPAGKYYIGNAWGIDEDVYDNVFMNKFNFREGLYRRKSDGVVFGVLRISGAPPNYKDKKTGDMVYMHNPYMTIVPLTISTDEYHHDEGKVVEFDKEIECSKKFEDRVDNFTFSIGDITLVAEHYEKLWFES